MNQTAAEMAGTESAPRVKVYELEGASIWIDRGTGFCTLEDYQGVLHLNVISETEPNQLLLDCVVQRGEVYQHQESTLIVWTEPTGEDLALSFEEYEGCLSILNQIAEFENVLDDQALNPSPGVEPNAILPPPTMANLGEIEEMIAESGHSIYQRDGLVSFIINEDYISQLRDVHEVCEDLEATAELYSIYNIMRRIILLNDSSIFEYIIRDDCIIGVVGMLEHDPQHTVEKGAYRNFLRNNERYREVVPINSPQIQAKIHQTYRLQYLKDAVLPRILDEGTLPIINSLIFFNHVEITTHIQYNHEFLKRLFDILSDNSPIEKKRDVLHFIRQFCGIVKGIPISHRMNLFRALGQHGLFSVFDFSLKDEDPQIRIAGTDILMSVIEQDRSLVRSYILAQTRQERTTPTLIEVVISCMKQNIGSELQVQCCEILRIILDNTPIPGDGFLIPPNIGIGEQIDRDTEDFLSLFYNRYIFSMMDPLLKLTEADVKQMDEGGKELNILVFLCELLCFLVRQHTYQSQYFVISSEISKNVIILLKTKHKHLKLSAIRFVRACIGLCDEVYNKHLVTNRLLKPIVDLFVHTCTRDNLITSACRDLFAFIGNHKIPTLLTHLIDVHSKTLEKTPDTLCFLRESYKMYLEMQQKQGGSGATTPAVNSTIYDVVGGSGARSENEPVLTRDDGLWNSTVTDAAEDAYFSESDDSEDSTADAGPKTNDLDGMPENKDNTTKSSPEKTNGISAHADDCENLSKDIPNEQTGTDTRTSPSKPSHGLEPTASNVALPNPDNSTNCNTLQNKKNSKSKDNGTGHDSDDDDGNDSPHLLEGNTQDNGSFTSRVTISEAFPESKPLARKLTAKPLLRRSGSQPQIRILLPSRENGTNNNHGSLNSTIGNAMIENGGSTKPYEGLKRSHSVKLGKRPRQKEEGKTPTFQKQNGINNRDGYGDIEKGSPDIDSTSDCGSPQHISINFLHPSSPVGLGGTGSDGPVTPKKAKTATS